MTFQPNAARGRRSVLRSAAAFGAAIFSGFGLDEAVEAKKLCRRNGKRCKKKGKTCKARFCRGASSNQPALTVAAPFSIEARWTNTDSDHDTYLFVPNDTGNDDPFPHIDFNCHPGNSFCADDRYPFICVSQDAQGPGDEITTVRQLLNGTYEYWIEIVENAPAADLAVVLRDGDGAEIRTWNSPANPNAIQDIAWHVLSIDGATGRVTSIDEVVIAELADGAHVPNTDVCPF